MPSDQTEPRAAELSCLEQNSYAGSISFLKNCSPQPSCAQKVSVPIVATVSRINGPEVLGEGLVDY